MKKTLRILVLVATLVMMMSLLTACLGSATTTAPATTSDTSQGKTPAGAKMINTGKIEPTSNTRVIQVGHVNPGNDIDHYTFFIREFSDNLMSLSNGKFALEVISDSQLGNERDLTEGMTMGTVDAAIITNLSFTSSIPETNILELPFLFKDVEQAYLLATNKEIADPIRKILLERWKIVGLTQIEGGFRETLSNTKEIKTMADFKGMKIRVPESPLFLGTYKALGANPTTMAFSEVFPAIQQKVIDGLEIPIASIYSTKLYEANKYLVLTNHIYTSATPCFSKSFWDTLSTEEQGWFTEACKKAAEAEVKFVREGEAKKIEEIKASGTKVIEIPDKTEFKNAVKPLYEEFKTKIGAELYDKAMAALKK